MYLEIVVYCDIDSRFIAGPIPSSRYMDQSGIVLGQKQNRYLQGEAPVEVL